MINGYLLYSLYNLIIFFTSNLPQFVIPFTNSTIFYLFYEKYFFAFSQKTFLSLSISPSSLLIMKNPSTIDNTLSWLTWFSIFTFTKSSTNSGSSKSMALDGSRLKLNGGSSWISSICRSRMFYIFSSSFYFFYWIGSF